MSLDEQRLTLRGPGASSDPERVFSACTAQLRPNRNRFELENFRQYFIVNRYLNMVYK